MTKEEILIRALNDRCKYESEKEMDYDTHLAIMDAMEEYAQQQVKNLNIPAVIKSVCQHEPIDKDVPFPICKHCGDVML